MKQKQNIAITSFQLVWAAMFCFAVLFTFHKPALQVYHYPASASQHPDKVSSEDRSTPLAWTEPTASKTVAEHFEKYLPSIAFISWLACPEMHFPTYKPGIFLAGSFLAPIRYLVQPNAP